MNDLNDFEITKNGKNKSIKFNNEAFSNLEDLLNTNLNIDENIQSYLDELNEINNNWDNLKQIVENKYNGFWDWETSQSYGVKGKWFTFAGYEDFTIYISAGEKNIYIENDLFLQHTIVILTIEEIIKLNG